MSLEENRSEQSGNQEKSPGRGMSRRNVLAAGLTASLIFLRFVLGGPGYQAPGDTLTIACVGGAALKKGSQMGCPEYAYH